MPAWKPGQSGNVAGRPPNSRALAALLREAGERKVKHGGHFVPRNGVVAEAVWELLTTGRAELVGGTQIEISGRDYLELVRFVHVHIDGPARVELDLMSGGEPVKAFIGFSPSEWDEQFTVDEPATKVLKG